MTHRSAQGQPEIAPDVATDTPEAAPPLVDLMQAASDVQALSKSFQAVLTVGAALQQIGSLGQATAEATKQRDALRAERDAEAALLFEAREQVDATKQVVNDATTEALQIVAAGRDQAATLIADAKATANALVRTAQAGIDARQGEIDAQVATLATLNDTIAAARITLQSLDEQIAAVRKAAATVAGV